VAADRERIRPDDPEIILNLWYVYDDMGIIYSLRARAYLGFGTDEEKLAFLQQFARTDYLIAQPFPIPDRLQMKLVEGTEKRKLPVVPKQAVDALGGAYVLFEEVFLQLEKQMPAQTRLTIGKNPLVCITPLLGDNKNNILPCFS